MELGWFHGPLTSDVADDLLRGKCCCCCFFLFFIKKETQTESGIQTKNNPRYHCRSAARNVSCSLKQPSRSILCVHSEVSSPKCWPKRAHLCSLLEFGINLLFCNYKNCTVRVGCTTTGYCTCLPSSMGPSTSLVMMPT